MCLGGCSIAGQIERDVGEHVFLAPDQPATSGFDQKRAGVDIEPSGGRLGVAQEARVHAGVAQGEGLAVDADRTFLQRADQVVGGIFEGVEIAAVLPSPCGWRRR